MNLDEIQSVRDRERQTDKLQQLRESFYEDVGEFIQQLRDQRERAAERADDPFDAPEVNRLSDEIDTAEQTVEAIYEKRVGKIVKAASFAAADLPAESDGMTAEEQELFETLVDDIKSNREHVMAVLAGETGPPTATDDSDTVTDDQPAPPEQSPPTTTEPSEERDVPQPETTTTDDSGVSAADVMGAAESTADDSSADRSPPPEPEPDVRNDGGTSEPSTDVDRETVRITEDVGDFLGFDEREYDLSENDVVTLPATNAEPLIERDAAQRLE